MRQGFKSLLFGAITLLTANSAMAGPWMTGPLLAPAGSTTPKGHIDFEPYFFDTDNFAIYNSNWHVTPTPDFNTQNVTPIVFIGLTDFLDFQITPPYNWNSQSGQRSNGFGDLGLVLGVQVLRQNNDTWMPDLRVSFQETFPTGRANDLNPIKVGTDATGAGSYQTAIGFNFQRLTQLANEKYLRTRLALTYNIPRKVRVSGSNAYGGGIGTFGTVFPGNQFSADLAFEYTLTQNWVPVFEALYVSGQSARFRGNPGRTATGAVATVGHGSVEQISLAPALEYNFNANVGIIGGVWFTVAGRDASDFVSAVVAVNIFI